MFDRPIFNLVIALVVIVLSGCASLGDDYESARDDYIEHREQAAELIGKYEGTRETYVELRKIYKREDDRVRQRCASGEYSSDVCDRLSRADKLAKELDKKLRNFDSEAQDYLADAKSLDSDLQELDRDYRDAKGTYNDVLDTISEFGTLVSSKRGDTTP